MTLTKCPYCGSTTPEIMHTCKNMTRNDNKAIPYQIGNFEHGFTPHDQEKRATEQIKGDLQILKDFILGFTARNVDKEWKAFQNLRTALLGE